MSPIPMPVRFQKFSSTDEPDPCDYRIRLVRGLIDHGATVLTKLMQVQDEGWSNEGTEFHFQKQRHTADNATPSLEGIWYNKMKGLLREIDSRLHCIPKEGPLQFLDLGCCPGGFSSYILGKNGSSRGIGVSLPVEDGGHSFLLEEKYHSRHKIFFANLTKYQLQSKTISDPELQFLPSEIIEGSFDLIVLDGHQLRTQLSARPGDMHRLLISQLIIALMSVNLGGTIIIKLSLPHKPLAARILYMLRTISTRLLRWKPAILHANRGTFYAVAEGVGLEPTGQMLLGYIRDLQELWFSLTYGGEDGGGRYMTHNDLDFIIPVDEIIASHLDWLAEFGSPLWHVQANALERLHKKTRIKPQMESK